MGKLLTQSYFLGALLLATPAVAQAPAPAQMGLVANTPNVVQVLDSSKTWATMGTVDPATHIFAINPATLLPYALLNSPAFIGTPTAPTPAPGDNTTKLATTGFVAAAQAAGTGKIVGGVTPVSGIANGALIMNSVGFAGDASGSLAYGNALSLSQLLFGGGCCGLFAYTADGLYLNVTPNTADRLQVYDATAPTAFRAYNTRTDASNGEWGAFDWQTAANTLTIGAQKNGTGTLRPVNIVGNPVTVNGAAIGGGTITANSTPTSGFTAGQLLMSDGTLAQNSGSLTVSPSAVSSMNFGPVGFQNILSTTSNGAAYEMLLSSNSGRFQVSGIPRTNPAMLRVFNTFSDYNNSEWGTFDWATTPNVLTIGPQANGTGTARNLEFVSGGSLAMDFGVNVGPAWATISRSLFVSGGFSANGAVNTPGLVSIIGSFSQPTITGAGGTCAASTKAGGPMVGTVVLSGVCAVGNTIVFTGLPAIVNGGFVCDAEDRTTRTAGPFIENASTLTGFTLTVGATSSVAGDVLQWKCMGY